VKSGVWMEGCEYICCVTAQTLKGFAKNKKKFAEKMATMKWKWGRG